MKNFTISFSLIVVFLLVVFTLPETSFSQLSSIDVTKQTTPTGQGPFLFTSSTAPLTFSLSGGESQLLDDLTPGMYTITETITPGTTLEITHNDDTCPGTTVTTNNATGEAMIDLAADCDLTVIFTNSGNSTITIQKNTNPNDNLEQFDFISNLPGQANFTITSATGLVVQDLVGGTYTIQEAITPGYTLTNISCNDLDATTNLATRTATILIDENDDDVTCTFTNTANGEIIIQKNTVPSGGLDFSFTENISDPNDTFMLDDGGSITFLDVSPGQYTVTEDDPTISPGGFFLSDIVCNDMGSSTNVATRTATIDLDPEEIITCTFTNTAQLDGLTMTKTDMPDPVSAGEELTYVIDIMNNSNFTATNVMLVDDLPPGLMGVSATGNIENVNCQFDNLFNPQTVTCTIPNLPPTQILAITIRVIPDPFFYDQSTIIQNTATLTADPGDVMRQSMTDTLVTAEVDASINPGNENRRVDFGANFTVNYDITVNSNNQQVLLDLNSDDLQIKADALDAMFQVDFPGEIQVSSVQTSQGNCTTTNSVQCDLGNILEGQTVRVSIVFIAPDFRGDFTIGALLTVLGGQSFSDFIFVSVRNIDNSDCSLAAAGASGTSNILYLIIPLFIFARRYWDRIKNIKN